MGIFIVIKYNIKMRSVRTKLQKTVQQKAKVTLEKFQNEMPESSE